jgi:2-polyprenyl-6-methoxyphenol hydroxylase-like FAD-dependent oxidoreductase
MKENQPIIDVLIVGGGPVGVGLGIELSLFGIKATIIERHLSPLELPRGQLLNPRSMDGN